MFCIFQGGHDRNSTYSTLCEWPLSIGYVITSFARFNRPLIMLRGSTLTPVTDGYGSVAESVRYL